MTTRRTPLPPYTHPLLRRQVEDWRRRAGVESATPSAPVVDDRSGWARWSRWWRSAPDVALS